MKRTIVYISGPLSTGDREENVQAFIDAHRTLMAEGYAVINPGLTHFVDPDDSFGWEAWIDADLALVEKAEVVVRLPGDSVGANAECEHAFFRGIQVVTMEELLA
jgi:hypothetical protein